MPETIPEKVGRYEIVSAIGRGGFSTVYLARDPYINRSVALKASETDETTARRDALSRLFREAEAAGCLIHPNIVTIYDAGIQEPLCYIAMEYIEGHTFHRNCLPEGLLPVAEAIDVIIKVCHALDYAHQRDVIHRDVKPSNILLGTNGEIKIADFGLACFAELSAKDRRTIGTPSYMPPEQVRGEGATPQSDLFSAGVILYQALSGHKPFEAQSSLEMRHKIVNEPHTPLSKHMPELPAPLAAITDRALSKEPDDRYQSGFDLARDLESVLRESAPIGSKLAERIKTLQSLSFFEEFTYNEIARLLNIGAWITHNRGEEIIRENDRGSSFYVLVSGSARVAVAGADVGLFGRGDCFGEMSFLLRRKRSATITAQEECHLLRLNPQKIKILPPDTQIKLYRLFARTIAGYLLKAEKRK